MKYIQNNKNKKGFTLVELIVVMSIIGILVLLAAPSFIGKTEEANRTKHFATVRILEDAAERYFIDHGKWPRGEEEPYTPEEVTAYAERIYDITGEEVVLEEGHYWDIDYEALSKYAKLPAKKDRDNYVVRNPVGKIYYLEGLDEEEKEVIDSSKNIPVETEEEAYQRRLKGEIARVTVYEGSGDEIVFHGLSPAAFDGNTNTYHTGVGTVTWEGDLADREISITGAGHYRSGTYAPLSFTFYNDAGEKLNPVNASQYSTTIASNDVTRTVRVVVPEGAVKMVFEGGCWSTFVQINDISLPTTTERPQNVNVTSATTPSSVTLAWDTVNRAIIYKNGTLLRDVTGAQTFTDTPLYADMEQVYDIVFMDGYGNGQKVQYKVTTPKHIVAFRGLSPAAFDGNTATYHTGAGTVTWEGDLSNRQLSITGAGHYRSGTYAPLSFTFYNDAGEKLNPVNASQYSTTMASNDVTRTVRVVVPEGAVKMVFEGGYWSTFVQINDISLPTTTERPQNVNVTSATTPSSVTLAWDTVNRAIIYKNGTLLRDVTGAQTFTDTPLYADTEQVYDIVFMDSYGNGKKVQYKVTTPKHIVAFRGLTPAAFDGNTSTYHTGAGTVTWEGDLAGRELSITGAGHYRSGTYAPLSFTFYNDAGEKLKPVNASQYSTTIASNDVTRTVRVVVPEGAVKMVFEGGYWSTYVQINDIQITK